MERGNGAERPLRSSLEAALAQVPPGRVTTYGDLARALGDVRAARAVGGLLATNERPEQVPCHRVVMADGSLGGYAFGGARAKAEALRAEGVRVRGGRVVGLEAVAVRSFDVVPVLSMMANRQRDMARQVRLSRLSREPRVAIGVDASYADTGAVAAACAFDLKTRELLQAVTVPFTPRLPYVPGYLAFRELDGVVAAARAIDQELREGAVLLVDGQGILHPRRCGIASMAGIELGTAAVGTAKRRLVGTVGSRAHRVHGHDTFRVTVDGEYRGARIGMAGSARGVYASPGSGLSVSQAVSLAARATDRGAKSPWPVRAADRACRRSAS